MEKTLSNDNATALYAVAVSLLLLLAVWMDHAARVHPMRYAPAIGQTGTMQWSSDTSWKGWGR